MFANFELQVDAARERAANQGLSEGPAQSGYTAMFGPVFVRQTECFLFVDSRHINPQGFVHGGLLSAFADYVCYVAALAHLPADIASPTVDLQLQYMSTARCGDTLRGQAVILRETRDLLFMRAELYNSETMMVAVSGVYKKVRHKPA